MSDISTESNTTACYGYCQYRLPCGYCKEMKSMCPFCGSGTVSITWGTSCTEHNMMNIVDTWGKS